MPRRANLFHDFGRIPAALRICGDVVCDVVNGSEDPFRISICVYLPHFLGCFTDIYNVNHLKRLQILLQRK